MPKDSGNIKNLVFSFVENNDENAFKTFFKLYYRKLTEFAVIFVKDEQIAKEVVSDVFFKLLKNKKKLLKVDNIQNYLFLCCKNQSLTYLKKNKANCHFSLKVVEDKDETSSLNPENKFLEKELNDVITTVVNNFPPKRQQVYKLIKEENLQYKEVARLLNISPKTVDNHLASAIAELRKKLNHYLNSQDSKPVHKIAQIISLLALLALF